MRRSSRSAGTSRDVSMSRPATASVSCCSWNVASRSKLVVAPRGSIHRRGRSARVERRSRPVMTAGNFGWLIEEARGSGLRGRRPIRIIGLTLIRTGGEPAYEIDRRQFESFCWERSESMNAFQHPQFPGADVPGQRHDAKESRDNWGPDPLVQPRALLSSLAGCDARRVARRARPLRAGGPGNQSTQWRRRGHARLRGQPAPPEDAAPGVPWWRVEVPHRPRPVPAPKACAVLDRRQPHRIRLILGRPTSSHSVLFPPRGHGSRVRRGDSSRRRPDGPSCFGLRTVDAVLHGG
jgi:hypothetical protein